MHKLIFILLILLILPLLATAQVPRTINYQAKLTDDAGIAMTDADRTIAFMIYNVESGGSPLWAETLSVNITMGLFDVQLGEVRSLALPFNEPYWIELKVDQNDDGDVIDATDETLEPREKLASVSYAFRAIYSDTAEFSENATAGISEEDFRLGTEGQHSMMRRLVTSCSELPTSGTLTWTEITNHTGVPYNFCISSDFPQGDGWYAAMDICTDLGGRICSKTEYMSFYGQFTTSIDDHWTNIFVPSTTGSSTIAYYYGGVCTTANCSNLSVVQVYLRYSFRCCTIIGN